MSGLNAFRILVTLSSWLLTFALHGIVAQLIALLAGRTLVSSPRARGLLWKTALLLPFVTATIAIAGWRPVTVLADVNLPDIVPTAALPKQEQVWVEKFAVNRAGQLLQTNSFATTSTAVLFAEIAAAAAALCAMLGLARLGIRHRAFERRLGQRTPIAMTDFDDVGHFRLTTSTTLGAPVALGLAEICIPAESFSALSSAEQRSVLIHEAAHLARRDPLWFAVSDLVIALVPWAPLVRIVARQLRRDAEFCCDAAVVSRIGDGHALVRSLATFASAFDPAETALVASCGGSPLEERARRILSPGRPAGWGQALALALALVVLTAGVLVAAPAVTTRTTGLRQPFPTIGKSRQVILIDERTH